MKIFRVNIDFQILEILSELEVLLLMWLHYIFLKNLVHPLNYLNFLIIQKLNLHKLKYEDNLNQMSDKEVTV